VARMSIDDSFLRDPRVLRLARRTGWSRRETIGALLDVWAVAYDRVTDVLPQEDIDIAAERDNFCCDMELVGLATMTRDGVRLNGVADRIAYLNHKRDAGRKGGARSGEARRDTNADHQLGTANVGGNTSTEANAEAKRESASPQAKHPSDGAQARGNPIPSASASAPSDHSPAPNPVVVPPGAGAPDKSGKRSRISDCWQPTAKHIADATMAGLDCSAEADQFRDHHTAKGSTMLDWDAAFRTWLRNAIRWGRNKNTTQQSVFDIVDSVDLGDGK
jgi:hypothetical protein